MLWHARIFFVRHPNLYPAEAKSADAVLPNAAAGSSAPMLRFEKSLWPKDHRLFLFYIILKAYETIAPQAG